MLLCLEIVYAVASSKNKPDNPHHYKDCRKKYRNKNSPK